MDVTTPRKLTGRAGITTHFARLPFDEVTTHLGIPTTTVPRTLADLAATATKRELDRALEQAEILRLTDPLSLGDLLRRDARRRGAVLIRHALHDLDGQATKEELEKRFSELLRRTGLPRPRTNALVDTEDTDYEVDCLWQTSKVIVELDGRETHLTPHAFERDRERDRRLAAAGYTVVRITWRQLRDEPGHVERDLLTLLSSRR